MSAEAHIERVRGWADAAGVTLAPDFPRIRDEGACLSIECAQGSPEWHLLRCGLPTASGLHRVITRKTRDYAASARSYISELLAERLLGQPLEWATTDWMRRGTDMEARARTWYELERGYDVRQVGFLLAHDGSWGGSPDGLVGTDGGVEIKVRGAKGHMDALLGLEPTADDAQVHGLLMLTGRAWWDVLAYNPRIPCRLDRVEVDGKYHEALAACLHRLHEDLAKAEAKLSAIGSALIDGSALQQQLRATLKLLSADTVESVAADIAEALPALSEHERHDGWQRESIAAEVSADLATLLTLRAEIRDALTPVDPLQLGLLP